MSYEKNEGKLCSVLECTYPAKVKGMCRPHYDRLRRSGTVEPYAWVQPTEKRCNSCEIVKPISSFYPNKKQQDGVTPRYSYYCKECAGLENYHRSLESKYGITMEQYGDMLHAQGGVCAICERPNLSAGKMWRLAVDHDHETGKVRGLLCQACNRMLGLVGDSVERLKKAVDYLEANL